MSRSFAGAPAQSRSRTTAQDRLTCGEIRRRVGLSRHQGRRRRGWRLVWPRLWCRASRAAVPPSNARREGVDVALAFVMVPPWSFCWVWRKAGSGALEASVFGAESNANEGEDGEKVLVGHWTPHLQGRLQLGLLVVAASALVSCAPPGYHLRSGPPPAGYADYGDPMTCFFVTPQNARRLNLRQPRCSNKPPRMLKRLRR